MDLKVLDNFSFFSLVNKFKTQGYEILIQYNTRGVENYQLCLEKSSVLSLKDFLHNSNNQLIESLNEPLYINILNNTQSKIVVIEYDLWLNDDNVDEFLNNVGGVI